MQNKRLIEREKNISNEKANADSLSMPSILSPQENQTTNSCRDDKSKSIVVVDARKSDESADKSKEEKENAIPSSQTEPPKEPEIHLESSTNNKTDTNTYGNVNDDIDEKRTILVDEIIKKLKNDQESLRSVNYALKHELNETKAELSFFKQKTNVLSNQSWYSASQR